MMVAYSVLENNFSEATSSSINTIHIYWNEFLCIAQKAWHPSDPKAGLFEDLHDGIKSFWSWV